MSVSSRNKSRKVRRLKSELRYYRSTYQEMSTAQKEYEKEWLEDSAAAMSHFLDIKQLEPESNHRLESEISRPETGAERQYKIPETETVENEEPVEENKQDSLEPPKWAKDLFRKIARRTHPDIVKGDDLIEIFRNATTSMESGDYDSLIDCAIDIDIDPGVSAIELEKKITSRIQSIKQKISKIEDSASWVWGESYGISETREKILRLLLSKSGMAVENIPEEKVRAFLNSLIDE